MAEPELHRCPDGSRFRISLVQQIREDPFVRGATHVYLVEPEDPVPAAPPDSGAGPAGPGPPPGGGARVPFQVRVHFAPIFLPIATPQERRHLRRISRDLVASLLDRGQRRDAELRVSSDGAVRLGDRVVRRLLPVVGSA